MPINANDLHNDNHSATYCPEDNKLRIYVNTHDGRVARDTYLFLRDNGYVSTPKQSCQFVATWSVAAEDIAYSLIPEYDEIGDEDTSPTDRAADRAERFNGYTGKRLGDSLDYSERMADSPQGFQSEAKAARAERRESRLRNHALSNWSKAEYWQRRTEGVISNALHRASADVRRGRIKRLEAEQRKHESTREGICSNLDGWKTVLTLEGADELIPMSDKYYPDHDKCNTAQKLAYKLANYSDCRWSIYHPTDEEVNAKLREIWHHGNTPYHLLTDNDFAGVPMRRLTPREVAELILAKAVDPRDPDCASSRYSRHLELRLTYERQMLANEGGAADDAEMIVGGWFGSYRILKVHKSNATKKAVSLTLEGKDGKPQRVNIQRLGAGHYREPTPEELAEFSASQRAKKASAKASTPKAPSLINPTVEDAKKLQAILNSHERKESDHKEIIHSTQKAYSSNSGGSYSPCATEGITERLEVYKPCYYGGTNQSGQTVIFKVRMYHGRVVVLDDKPQKSLPWEACEAKLAEHPTFEETAKTVPEFYAWRSSLKQYATKDELTPEMAKLFAELRYWGLATNSTMFDLGLNNLGMKYLYASYLASDDWKAKDGLAGFVHTCQQYGLTDSQGNITNAELVNLFA